MWCWAHKIPFHNIGAHLEFETIDSEKLTSPNDLQPKKALCEKKISVKDTLEKSELLGAQKTLLFYPLNISSRYPGDQSFCTGGAPFLYLEF